jgi:hypothetical protein
MSWTNLTNGASQGELAIILLAISVIKLTYRVQLQPIIEKVNIISRILSIIQCQTSRAKQNLR